MSYPQPQPQPYYQQMPPPPPPKKGMSGGMIFGIVAGVLVLCLCGAGIIGVVVWQSGAFHLPGSPGYSVVEASQAKVGDCLDGTTSSAVVVSCSDSYADVKIASIVTGKTRREGESECRVMRDVYTQLFFADDSSSSNGPGRTLCLAPNKS